MLERSGALNSRSLHIRPGVGLLVAVLLSPLTSIPSVAAEPAPAIAGADAATIAIWRQRWGYYVDMLGVPHVSADVATGSRPNMDFVYTASWKVPGESILFTISGKYSGTSTLRWDQSRGHVVNEANGTSLMFQPDGSVINVYSVGDATFRTTSRMRKDRIVEYVGEKQIGTAWEPFNHSLQIPIDQASAYLSRPIPSFEDWIGKRLVSAEGGRIIQMSRGTTGPWALDVFLPDGRLEGRFEMGAAKEKLIESVAPYELPKVALSTCNAELPTLEDQQTLVMEHSGIPVLQFEWVCGKRSSTGFKGSRQFQYTVRPTPEGLQVNYQQLFTPKNYESRVEWDRKMVFVPVTDALLAKARETYEFELEQARLAAELQRDEQRERDAAWSRTMGALSTALSVANEVASASEADSRAALEATLGAAARQAGRERERDAQGSSVPSSVPTATAGSTSVSSGSTIAQRPAEKPSAAAPMRFVLDIGLQPRTGDTVNPTCYSGVITQPGPPCWGQGGFLPPGSSQAAYDTVQSFKNRFIAACESASGREVTSEGNFHWTWNETPDGDRQVSSVRARAREDVTVDVD